jgi:kynurenine 3-monooxygenase
LDQILDDKHEDWGAAFEAYQHIRKRDTDAIADLAVENYYEMRDHVDNPEFITKRAIEMQLEKKFPDYASKYNLVTFCEHIPYSVAKQKGHFQDKWLLEYCRNLNDPNLTDEELESIYKTLIQRT